MPDGIDDRQPARAAAGGSNSPSPVVAAKVRVPPATALPRERLQLLLDSIWSRRLGVVIAPAGSGKTTLLAEFATGSGVPVAWYRAEIVGRRRGLDGPPPRGGAAAGAAGRARRLGHGPGRGTGPRGEPRRTRAPRRRRRPRPRGDGRGGRARPVRRVRPALARDRLRVAARAVDQPEPTARRRRPRRDRPGRPAVPGVGGRAPVPGPLRRARPARRAGRPRPPDRGLGGRPPAVPPRDARQVRGRAAPDPRRGRGRQPAHPRVPDVERPGRPARGAARVPRRDVRAGPADGAALRQAPRPARQRRAPRRAVPPPDLHGRARRGRRVVPLPRGLPVAPRPDARRPGGRGGGPRPLRPGRGVARGGRGDRGGARARTAEPRTGPRFAGCSADRARDWPIPRRPGSRACRRRSSATSRGSSWRPPGGRGRKAAGPTRSTRSAGPRAASGRRRSRSSAIASGRRSGRGSSRGRRARRATGRGSSARASSASR